MATRVQKLKKVTLIAKTLADNDDFFSAAKVNLDGNLVLNKELIKLGFTLKEDVTLTEPEVFALYNFIQENYIDQEVE